jgi:hypothetical protein
MNLHFRFFVTLLVFWSLLGLFAGCKKENTISSAFSSVSERSETAPMIDHGMLKFSGYKAAENFVKSMQLQEENVQLVKNAYAALGVDTAAEATVNLTDHPLCLLHDRSLSFVSKRQIEEVAINTALDNGEEVFSIVSDPYWKTILNADGSVILGNRIYRYFDNGGIVIIPNMDWAAYASISTKQFDQIRQDYNILVTSVESDSWALCFDLDSDSHVLQEKFIKVPRFEYLNNGNGSFSLKNLSLTESVYGANSFQWKYSDGSTSTGREPNRNFSTDEQLLVKISTGHGADFEIPVPQVLVPCPENFTITKLQNNKFRFELPGFVACSGNVKLRWTFSDGYVSGWNVNPIERTFTSNGWVRAEYWRCSDGEGACFITKPVIVKCGDQKTESRSMEFTQSGEKWKLDGQIWVKAGEVGCGVKYLRWRGPILKWRPAYNRGSSATVSGTYIREANTVCLDINASQSKSLGAGTHPSYISATIPEVTNVFVKPSQLSARLGISVEGTWRGWGYAGVSRLILP